MKRIHVRKDLCSGCRACMVACVAAHDGVFGTATARLHVIKDEAIGLDEPHVCRLCRRPPCADACPTGALNRDEALGAVRLRPELCIGCWSCVDACPFGMADLHLGTGLANICDLCGGDPACVNRCAPRAIIYGERGDPAIPRWLEERDG